jgi:alpha-beta hydrolase superfamily lysophospholipase
MAAVARSCRLRRTGLLVRAAVIVSPVVVLLLGLAGGLQRHLIYLPATEAVPLAAAVLPIAHEVTSRPVTDRSAWFVPAGRPDRGTAVLMGNGNAGTGPGAPLARALAQQGPSVLLFDDRGHGGNPGNPDERGLARDVRAAHQFLVKEAGFSDEHLLIFGESHGAAVVTELVTELPPAGVVLRSPFVDLTSVGRVHDPFLPVRTLLMDKYPLADRLAAVTAPRR